MRALVAYGAGDLQVEERAAPQPAAGQIAVRIRYGGICGSDLHYWRHGRVGDFWLREPLVLGHEVVGTVRSLGAGVAGPEPGTPVAVHPATVCGRCPECAGGRPNLCREVRYLGSAARLPHVQGGLAEVLVVPADQVLALPDGLSLHRASIAEPASVAWHAVARAGAVAGRRVLVTGAGPIGTLVVAALRRAGAGEIVVTDVAPGPLAIAVAAGAHTPVLVGRPAEPGPAPDAPDGPAAALGGLEADVAIESSGSSAGLGTCVRAVRRGGRVVGLGLLPPGDSPFPGNLVVTRELELVGAFRFQPELGPVLTALADGSLAADMAITHTLPFEQAVPAFELAADPQRSCKVLLDLGSDEPASGGPR